MFTSLRHRFKSSTRSLIAVIVKITVNGIKATYKYLTKTCQKSAIEKVVFTFFDMALIIGTQLRPIRIAK